MIIRDKLVHAVTAFDAKQEAKARKNPRAYHNVYALAQYLARVADVIADVENGAEIGAAIIAGFTPGPLRQACLKEFGLINSRKEAYGNYLGMPVYQPVSKGETK